MPGFTLKHGNLIAVGVRAHNVGSFEKRSISGIGKANPNGLAGRNEVRFRSKLIEIDAECFIKDKPLPFRDERAVCYDGHNWYVESRGRKIVVDPGDWIIREPDGKGFYPCKSDIFVQRYEPITAEQLNDGALERLVEALRYAKAFGNHGVIEGGPHHGMSVSFFVNEALKPFTEQPNDHNA